MAYPLIVHGDPRKMTRSATVMVAPGRFKIDTDAKDSSIKVVTGAGNKFFPSGGEFECASVTTLWAEIEKAGTEQHISVSLVAVNN